MSKRVDRGTARVRHRFAPMTVADVVEYATRVFGEEAVATLPRYVTTGGAGALPGRIKCHLQWYSVYQDGTWSVPVPCGAPKNELKRYKTGAVPLVFVTLSMHNGIKKALLRAEDVTDSPEVLFHSKANDA